MSKHNQTAVFYQEKWDMQFGHSSQLLKDNFEKSFHKYVAKHFNEGFSQTNTSTIHTPFTQVKSQQSRLRALLLSMTSRQQMRTIQADCVQDKVYPMIDVQNVVERMMQDLKQITGQADIRSMYKITETQIAQCCHDIKILAEAGYLQFVDICLLNQDRRQGNRVEQKAYRFEMNTAAKKVKTNRPNSMFISQVDKSQPALRIVLKYTSHYTRDAQLDLESQLFAGWKAAYCDITHSPLRADIDRDYSCNGYAIQRKIFC
jgi:acyl-CoA synthetase (AMP-forming)/AMP-acid ligase II